MTGTEIMIYEGPAPAKRAEWTEVLLSGMTTGTIAGLVTGSALGLLARVEGKGALQPMNATSHWLHGPDAGERREADAAHTVVGASTHQAAAMFWATGLEWWLARREDPSPGEVVAAAGVTAGVAAAVDYGLAPRRATPGWEHAVSPRSIAAAFGAMALGLAAGAFVTRAMKRRMA